MKRGQSGLSGIVAVDKPAGITSHDVVNRVRRMSGERRVGHAGTLDPAATGLMLVCIGAATRLSQYLTGHDKRYRARFVFGVRTDTDDLDGRVIASVGDEEVRQALAGLDPQGELDRIVGEQMQLPPAYSAIKKNGVVAYKAAREGAELELEARPVVIHSARFAGSGTVRSELSDADGETFLRQLPYWDIDLHVSKGTYIRSIARDFGVRLGCSAHLGALRRTAVSHIRIEEALTIEQLQEAFEQKAHACWCDPAAALGFTRVEIDESQAADVANGRKLRLAGAVDGLVSCVRDGKLLAIYEARGGMLVPATVIPGGVCGVA